MPRSRPFLAFIAAVVLASAACSPAPGNSATPASAPASAGPTAAATLPPTPAATVAAGVTGAWDGTLDDPSGSYPVHVTLEGCATVGSACGSLEYLEGGPTGNVFCASELTLTAVNGDTLAFSEAYVYHGWNCFQTTYEMTLDAAGSLVIDQFGEPGVACCHGTLTRAASGPAPTPAVPGTVAGFGRATSTVPLGGGVTQYAVAGAGSLWFPLDDLGIVARVDPATGKVTARIAVGDPGSLQGLKSDPHAVVVGETGIWVGQAAGRAVARIDPATNVIAETIALPVIPYALAIDGNTLWVTSFEDDKVVRVDLTTNKVVAQVAVSKPTGVAVGFGGVWVVRHRDDVLVRIDPASNKVAAEISLGKRGPSELCGMCVENVVVSDGSVWTANNEGRSVSRIDPQTNKVAATIQLPLRAWTVSAGDGEVWASQFDTSADGAFVDPGSWGVARIDPATGKATTHDLPGTFSVLWAGGVLWIATPTRRGDLLTRFELGAG